MSIAVGSVIYKQAVKYLDDFFISLKNQTMQNFDVILVNDDIDDKEFSTFLKKYIHFFGSRIKVIKAHSNIFQPYLLRIQLLKAVKEFGYDFLVLCDCDDKCAFNRIEMSQVNCETERWFFYNELLNFDDQNLMPPLPLITEDILQLIEYNYLGLTNTMLVMRHISYEFIKSLKEGNTKVFDWYLYSRILLAGGTGEKIENTYTYYRIHQENIAGVARGMLSDIMREKQIKQKHYSLLRKYNPIFEKLLNKYENLILDDSYTKQKGSFYWWGILK